MSQKKLSPEDRLDGVYRLIACVFLIIGLMHVVGALKFVIPQGGWFSHLGVWVRYAVLLLVPALCVLTLWKSFSFKRACAGCSLLAREGFVFGAIQKSAVRAGFLVFLALVLMHAVSDDFTLPAKFYLTVALAILTLTFSISYLLTSYVSNADE